MAARQEAGIRATTEPSGQPAAGAFDRHRPPDLGLIEDCVHCRFCLPTCPTYKIWGDEMDSPRGRIVLMKAAIEESQELSDEMALHWDNCLGCMACVTSCPSGRWPITTPATWRTRRGSAPSRASSCARSPASSSSSRRSGRSAAARPGVYNVLKPEPAAELGRRKAENLIATGADAIVAANPGCTLQLQAHLPEGKRLPVYHPLELVAMSIEGERP